MSNMKTTSIFKITVLFLIVLSVVSCTGNKGGLDNQESDTVMIAKDSIPFVLKHLDFKKKKVMEYVTCSEHTVDSFFTPPLKSLRRLPYLSKYP